MNSSNNSFLIKKSLRNKPFQSLFLDPTHEPFHRRRLRIINYSNEVIKSPKKKTLWTVTCSVYDRQLISGERELELETEH